MFNSASSYEGFRHFLSYMEMAAGMLGRKIIVPPGLEVLVEPRAVIQVSFDRLSNITLSRTEDDLIVTGSDGHSVVLRSFFVARPERDQPIVQFEDNGPFLTVQQIIDLTQYSVHDLFQSEEDVSSGAGAGFNKFNLGDIGDGLSIAGLLDPTELSFSPPNKEMETYSDLAGNLGTGD
ncbi:hypothetical protein, partial [Sneathiella sp.]|uniref:hypothetical protein n=1 Tax=Sneathiella sp. TaxID=1964365 RepID=UPI002608EADA